MFALRGIAVSLSAFSILYLALSLLVCLSWRRLSIGKRFSARHYANWLFFLRTAPFLLAAGVTLVLALPSFLLLEPRSIDERMSLVPVVLGLCGGALLLAGASKAVSSLWRATQATARWSGESHLLARTRSDHGILVSVSRTSAVAPPLTAAGILRPQVWLSTIAEFVLTERELQAALRHEIVHVDRHDNLRKLVLRFVAFPGMARLENAWREATEIAADDAAVFSCSEALDLAAAVIKLSRITPLQQSSELATALVHSPAKSLNERVNRLIEWSEQRQKAVGSASLWYPLSASATVLLALAFSYHGLLVRVHALTEWLVG